MAEKSQIVADLIADGDEFDRLLVGLDESAWKLETPAPGWTVAHQVAHLAATFRMAGLAAAAPDRFTAMMSQLGPDFAANVDRALTEFLVETPPVLLSRWRAEQERTEQALAAVPGDRIVPWLVRPLPAAVLTAAGMMELFAHGQDVADALGVRREHTDRLRHLVGFAVRTWDFGYLARDLTPPPVEFRFEITGPSGDVWTFGPAGAEQRITGPAEDFCLLVTRRRHHTDLDVVATGPDAEKWLEIAQAYRGPAGPGRRPGQFARSGATR